MNRIDRIERTLAEADAADRGFPLARPALARVSVHREDLRALVMLARSHRAVETLQDDPKHSELAIWKEFKARQDALAALEEPCEP